MHAQLLLGLILVLTLHFSHGASAGTITGTVLNNGGHAEAGVWVVAETSDLPTEYRKLVVTDHEGRFVIPELPAAQYEVWVRGYGLVDSDRYSAAVGAALEITVDVASEDSEAALVYPANYWLSLLDEPAHSSLADDPAYANAQGWLSQLKLNCALCHQLGAAPTRLGSTEAFDAGLKKAGGMNYFASTLGRKRLLDVLERWSSKIARGTVPPAPPRPQGHERNFVITQWGWGDRYTYAHDEIATDKRSPSINANGPVYGVDLGNDYLLELNPQTHTAGRHKVPTRDGFETPWCEQTYQGTATSDVQHFGFGSLGCPAADGVTPYQGKYINPANPHNPMMDSDGRVWITTQIRRQWDADLPEFCRDDPVIRDRRHHRQLAYFEPSRQLFELVDTCFGTHHLQFDESDRLYTSGDDYVIGWVDTRKFDPTDKDSLARSVGYSEVRIDSDGDGDLDQALTGFRYGLIPNPADGSVWSAVPPGLAIPSGSSGRLERFDPATGRHEIYTPPSPGLGPRGVDVDTQGNIWTALAGSGHVARFDRRRCTQYWGHGDQCPQGWTMWRTPGPQFADGTTTDMHYYLWVDQFDTLGMGPDSIVINGTNSDSLIVFRPDSETFTVIRIPYPMNTFTRGLDGRIDDPSTGWKGRGLWFTNGIDPVVHSEVQRSYAAKIQYRPHPLAH